MTSSITTNEEAPD